MLSDSIQTLIVEDDFRVAEINRQFVDQVDGFHVVHVAKTGEQALAYLKNSVASPQLILLDVYMPDSESLNLFWEIRRNHPKIDLIMVTAAKEVATIRETLQGGIFDYIIKPVDFIRLETALTRYSHQHRLLASREELEQAEIDQLIGLQVKPSTKTVEEGTLPKGIDQLTLNKIKKVMQLSDEQGITALRAGEKIGVSRSTARRYLEHLVSTKEVVAQLNYGEVGRPERRYTLWTL